MNKVLATLTLLLCCSCTSPALSSDLKYAKCDAYILPNRGEVFECTFGKVKCFIYANGGGISCQI